MSDAEKKLTIAIQTTADTAGAQAATASLEGVKNEAAATAPAVNALAEAQAKLAESTAAADKANRDFNAALPTQQGRSGLATDLPAALAGGQSAEVDKVAEAEERRNSLIQQRQAIITTETEAMGLQLVGREEEAAVLDKELAVMRESYSLQTKGMLSEAEATALAKERVALRTQEAEMAARTAAADALDAKEGAIGNRLLRGAGRASGLGRSTGLAAAFGPEVMTAIIGVQAAMDVVRGIMHSTEEEAKAAAKAAADAAKAHLESIKEIADAAKKSLAEAKAEAEAFVTATDKIGATVKTAAQKIAAKEDLETKADLSVIDVQEKRALAEATTDEQRSLIKENSAQAREGVKRASEGRKLDAEQTAADLEKGSIKDSVKSVGDQLVSADELAHRLADKDREKAEAVKAATHAVEAAKKGEVDARSKAVTSQYEHAGSSPGERAQAQAAAEGEMKRAEAARKLAEQRLEFAQKDSAQAEKESHAATQRATELQKAHDELLARQKASDEAMLELTHRKTIWNNEQEGHQLDTQSRMKQQKLEAELRKNEEQKRDTQTAIEAAENDITANKLDPASLKVQAEDIVRLKKKLLDLDEAKRALEGKSTESTRAATEEDKRRVGVEAGAHLEELMARGVEKGAERGIASGLKNHTGAKGHGHGHHSNGPWGKDGLSSGPAGDGLKPGHAGDGLKGASAQTTDFDKALEARGLKRGTKEFDDAFSAGNQHQIDNRTRHTKDADASAHNAQADSIESRARDAMNNAAGHGENSLVQKLTQIIETMITHLEQLKQGNKNDSNAGAMKQVEQRLTVAEKKLAEAIREIELVNSRAKNNR